MAIFRKIHVTFWSDSYTSELKEKEKLFYLYLLTNDRTTQLGCYEITKKQMAFDLGYSIDTVSILLKKFEKDGKIRYNSDTCEVALRNWNKYNKNESSKVQSLVNKEIACIKDKSLIQYLYCIDTVSILNPQEEEEQEEEEQEEQTQEEDLNTTIIKDIVSFLNTELGTVFKDTSKATIDPIKARINEGYTFDDFKKVITTKKANWQNTDMAMYLRPSTLFGSKFESYLNEPVKTSGVTVMGLPAEVEYEYFAEYNQKWYSLSAYRNAAGKDPGENIPKRIKK